MDIEISDPKRREQYKLKLLVDEIVHELKYKKDVQKAAALIIQNNLSLEKLLTTTVRISLDNLAALADAILSKK
jgi:hypothetical protein